MNCPNCESKQLIASKTSIPTKNTHEFYYPTDTLTCYDCGCVMMTPEQYANLDNSKTFHVETHYPKNWFR